VRADAFVLTSSTLTGRTELTLTALTLSFRAIPSRTATLADPTAAPVRATGTLVPTDGKPEELGRAYMESCVYEHLLAGFASIVGQPSRVWLPSATLLARRHFRTGHRPRSSRSLLAAARMVLSSSITPAHLGLRRSAQASSMAGTATLSMVHFQTERALAPRKPFFSHSPP
jgi:hypothetical protein